VQGRGSPKVEEGVRPCAFPRAAHGRVWASACGSASRPRRVDDSASGSQARRRGPVHGPAPARALVEAPAALGRWRPVGLGVGSRRGRQPRGRSVRASTPRASRRGAVVSPRAPPGESGPRGGEGVDGPPPAQSARPDRLGGRRTTRLGDVSGRGPVWGLAVVGGGPTRWRRARARCRCGCGHVPDVVDVFCPPAELLVARGTTRTGPELRATRRLEEPGNRTRPAGWTPPRDGSRGSRSPKRSGRNCGGHRPQLNSCLAVSPPSRLDDL
jgi:hypothetical protein